MDTTELENTIKNSQMYNDMVKAVTARVQYYGQFYNYNKHQPKVQHGDPHGGSEQERMLSKAEIKESNRLLDAEIKQGYKLHAFILEQATKAGLKVSTANALPEKYTRPQTYKGAADYEEYLRTMEEYHRTYDAGDTFVAKMIDMAQRQGSAYAQAHPIKQTNKDVHEKRIELHGHHAHPASAIGKKKVQDHHL